MEPKKQLKILFSHYGYRFGGGFGRSYMLAKELVVLGYNVTFLTSQRKGFIFPYKVELIDGLKLVSFPDIVPLDLREKGFGILTPFLKALYVLFKRYDILHSDSGHRPNAGLPCIINRLLHRTVYIAEWWDFYGKGGQYDLRPILGKFTIGIWDRITEIPCRKISDGIVALSEFTKTRAMQNNIPESKITVIHGGSDYKKIKYYNDNNGIKKKYGLNPDILTFGYIGMMKGEVLNILPFINAINNIKEKIKINWFTTGMKLPNQFKKKNNIGDELLEFGWLEYNIFSEIISCADVFILLHENTIQNNARWPNKIGDYFAAGRLIIANPIGEITKLISQYPRSFINVDWSEKSIAGAIISISSEKRKLVDRGLINRELAKERFSWSARSKELESFYLKILYGEI